MRNWVYFALTLILLLSPAFSAGVIVQNKDFNVINGNITLDSGQFILTSSSVGSSMLPSSSASYDLGSSTAQWRNVYISGSLYDEGTTYYVNPAGTSNISGLTASTSSIGTLSVSGTLTAQGNLVLSALTSCEYLATDASGTVTCQSFSSNGVITGSGTANYIPKFTGSTTIGNSQIYDNGTNVGIGTTSPSYKLDVSGTARVTSYLVVGSTTPRTTSSSRIIIPGGTSDYIITVQDGTGRVQHYWNATPGTSPTYLVSNEAAGKILFHPASSNFFQLFWAPAGTAGSAITWSEKFRVDTSGYAYANRFVDLGGTSYYLDPASTSVLNTVNVTDLSCTDCISLGTETAGNYVAAISAGNGISVTNGSGEGVTPVITAKIGTGLAFDTSGNIELNTTYTDSRYVNEGQANSITSSMIVDGTITSADIADGTITNADIANTTKYVSVQNSGGTEQFAVTDGSPSLRIANGTGISVSFNSSTHRVTISHADTSTQSSVNNSGGTVIQDVTLDGYGHVTGLTSANLDGRYVNAGGDTMTGDLKMSSGKKVCFDGATCSAYIYYDGSKMVIKVG